MSAIIAALLAAIGPLLIQALQKWLASIFNKSAKKLPAAETFATPTLAAHAVIDQSITDTPRRMFLRRALLRSIKTHAGTVMQGLPLTSEAIEEIQDVGTGAAKEK